MAGIKDCGAPPQHGQGVNRVLPRSRKECQSDRTKGIFNFIIGELSCLWGVSLGYKEAWWKPGRWGGEFQRRVCDRQSQSAWLTCFWIISSHLMRANGSAVKATLRPGVTGFAVLYGAMRCDAVRCGAMLLVRCSAVGGVLWIRCCGCGFGLELVSRRVGEYVGPFSRLRHESR